MCTDSMARPLFLAPVRETWMLEWCLDTVADQSPFPVIDDFGELEAGDVVYATIDLAKDPSSVKDVVEEKYALPGTIKINEDGTKTVELFESALWDGGGFARADHVVVQVGLLLRLGPKPMKDKDADDEAKEFPNVDEADTIDGLYVDPIDDVVEVARDQVMKGTKAFAQYISPTVDKVKTFDYHKWGLFKTIAAKMAMQMTVAAYKAFRPADANLSVITTEEAKKFKDDFVEPALAELVSGCVSEDDRKEYQGRIGKLKTKTNLKYVCMIMDIVVAGPDGASPESEGKADGVKDDTDVSGLKDDIASLARQITVLSAQLRLGSPGGLVDVSKLGGDAKAKVLVVKGDNSCAYNVMYAGGVKSTDADAKLDLGPESTVRMSKLARKTVCKEANKVWLRDKKDFEGKYGPYQKFMETILTQDGGSETWPEFCQWSFFASAYKRVEYRIKQKVENDGACDVQTYSTKQEGGPQPEFVMFPWFRNKNHYDICAVEEGGESAYVFPFAKAAAAEALIDAFLKGGSSKQVKDFALDLDEKELDQLLDGVLGLAADADGEEPFTAVEGKNSKKKKKKAEGEAKAAADAKKMAAKAEADADARVAKAAAKAAADLLGRNAGGGAWAQQKAQRQDGRGWKAADAQRAPPAQRARQGQGAQQQPQHSQPDNTPAVVVFGDGSKKSLRRAVRALDPTVEAAITAVYKIEAGTPRAILYCNEEDLELVLAIVPMLREDGLGCAAYKEQAGGARGRKDQDKAPPKAKQAERGLRDASLRAGVCKYMATDEDCPYRGQCKFVCYDQQRSAQRRQPSGWRR